MIEFEKARDELVKKKFKKSKPFTCCPDSLREGANWAREWIEAHLALNPGTFHWLSALLEDAGKDYIEVKKQQASIERLVWALKDPANCDCWDKTTTSKHLPDCPIREILKEIEGMHK